jgi:hypothetical protein
MKAAQSPRSKCALTHAYARTHARAHALTSTRTRMHEYTHTHARAHARSFQISEGMHFLFELFDSDGAKTIEGYHTPSTCFALVLARLPAGPLAYHMTGCAAPWR